MTALVQPRRATRGCISGRLDQPYKGSATSNVRVEITMGVLGRGCLHRDARDGRSTARRRAVACGNVAGASIWPAAQGGGGARRGVREQGGAVAVRRSDRDRGS